MKIVIVKTLLNGALVIEVVGLLIGLTITLINIYKHC